MKKYAFTISEVLVTLAVIGIVAMLTIPLVNHIIPNQDIVLAKKSLDIVQRNVQYLTNDSKIYVDGTFDSFPYGTASAEEPVYFCKNFADQLNTKGTIDCAGSNTAVTITVTPKAGVPTPSAIDNACSNIGNAAFKTTDGIRWHNMKGTFTEGAYYNEKYNIICVKVSDEAKAFGIAIREDGKTVPGEILSTCLDADPKTDNNADCPLY